MAIVLKLMSSKVTRVHVLTSPRGGKDRDLAELYGGEKPICARNLQRSLLGSQSMTVRSEATTTYAASLANNPTPHYHVEATVILAIAKTVQLADTHQTEQSAGNV